MRDSLLTYHWVRRERGWGGPPLRPAGDRQGTQIYRNISFIRCTTHRNAGLIKLNYSLVPLFNEWMPRIRGSCWNKGDWHNSKPSNFLVPDPCCVSGQVQPPTSSSWHLPAQGGCLTYPRVCKVSPSGCIYTHPKCFLETFHEQLLLKVQDGVQMIDSLVLLFHKVVNPSHKSHAHPHTVSEKLNFHCTW